MKTRFNFYIFVLLVLFNQCVLSAVLDIYVDPKSTAADDGCGSDALTACRSLPVAVAQYQKQVGNQQDNSVVVHLVDGVYGGNENGNVNIYALNITLLPVSATPNVVFQGSTTSNSSALLFVQEPQSDISANISRITNVVVEKITFTKFNSMMIVSSFLQFGSLSLSVDNCVFSENSRTANTTGGGIVSIDGARNNTKSYTVSIKNSQFTQNSAVTGSALYFGFNVVGSIDSCTFSGNTATRGSAVLYSSYSVVSVSNSVFENQVSRQDCSTITLFQEGASVSVFNNCSFNGNNAYGRGGVLCLHDSNANITNSNFNNNRASSNGGSIFTSAAYTTLYSVNFINNTAQKGGAMSVQDEAFVKSFNCVYDTNSAIGDGGAISVEFATLQLFNSVMKSSTGNDRGGALYTYHSQIALENSTIDGNLAPFGGAIYCSASDMSISGTTVSNNTDTHYGTHSYEYEDGSMEILVNDRNIYCSQFPAYTFCTISGDQEFSSLCGEVYVVNKPSGLSKGQLAGIIIGSIMGAAVLAFGFGVLWAKSTISEIFTPLKATINEDEDEENSGGEVKHL